MGSDRLIARDCEGRSAGGRRTLVLMLVGRWMLDAERTDTLHSIPYVSTTFALTTLLSLFPLLCVCDSCLYALFFLSIYFATWMLGCCAAVALPWCAYPAVPSSLA